MYLLVSVFVLTLAWTSVHCDDQRDKLFFLEKSSGDGTKTLLVVTWQQSVDDISAGCEIFTDKDLINEVLKSSDGAKLRTLSENDMESLLEDCTKFSLKMKRRESDKEEESSPIDVENIDNISELRQGVPYSERRTDDRDARMVNESVDQNAVGRPTTTEAPTTVGNDRLPVIFPGTKWCGVGDRAKNYDDLGTHQDTDRCCRAHDLCNDTLAPGETRHDLTNESFFTKFNCQCDNDFFNCLHRVNSMASNTIGKLYFNLLKRECYEKDYPNTKKCLKYSTLLKAKCLEYEKDMTAEPTYQWIPAKKY